MKKIMKKIIYLIVLVLTVTVIGCQKEDPITPQPVAKTAVINTSSGSGTNSNPPSIDNSFYLSFNTNSLQNVSRLALTEMVPEVLISGIPLTYIGKDGSSWTQHNIINMTYEYEIPSSVDMTCNDSIDFTVTYDIDSMVNIEIYEIQVHHVKTEMMYQKMYGFVNPLEIENLPDGYVHPYTDIKVLCD